MHRSRYVADSISLASKSWTPNRSGARRGACARRNATSADVSAPPLRPQDAGQAVQGSARQRKAAVADASAPLPTQGAIVTSQTVHSPWEGSSGTRPPRRQQRSPDSDSQNMTSTSFNVAMRLFIAKACFGSPPVVSPWTCTLILGVGSVLSPLGSYPGNVHSMPSPIREEGAVFFFVFFFFLLLLSLLLFLFHDDNHDNDNDNYYYHYYY